MNTIYRISALILLVSLFYSCSKEDTTGIRDGDGNIYTSVQIGTQIWLTENLKTTKFNDGVAIPLVTDNTAGFTLTTPGYCWYNNDELTYKNAYGALYNWYAVNSGNICPQGWHVPTDSEWTTLITSLGGESVAGGKLKESGTTHWQSPTTGTINTTNESGFTGLPGGYRGYQGVFAGIGKYGEWWSSSADDTSNANTRLLNFANSDVIMNNVGKWYGFSVRCLKDN